MVVHCPQKGILSGEIIMKKEAQYYPIIKKLIISVLIFSNLVLLTSCQNTENDELMSTQSICTFLAGKCIPYEVNGKWGLQVVNAGNCTEPIYDDILLTEDDKYYITKRYIGNEQCTGVIGLDGTRILQEQYDIITYMGDGFFLVKMQGEYQLCNVEKDENIEVSWLNNIGDIWWIDSFQQNVSRIAVISNNEYLVYYMDTAGRKIIDDVFKDGSEFNNNGVALVLTQDNRWKFIDKNGTTMMDTAYSDADFAEIRKSIGDDLFCVNIDSTFIIADDGIYDGGLSDEGLINTEGELLGVYESIGDMYNEFELIPVCKNGKWGYIDSSGEVVIDFKYERAYGSQKGIMCVKKNGKYGAINSDDEEIIPFKFYEAFSFDNQGMWTIGKCKDQETGIDHIVKIGIDNNGEYNENNFNGPDIVQTAFFNLPENRVLVYGSPSDNQDMWNYYNPYTGNKIEELSGGIVD